MAKGISTEAQPWVAKCDRDLPRPEQTVFWIFAKNHSMSNEHAKIYAKARKGDGAGDFDPLSLDRANKTEFADVVPKVENWGWAPEYLNSHPDVAGNCNEAGFFQKPITHADANIFGDMIEQMSISLFNEVLDAARNQAELEAGHPKNWENPLS